MISLESKASLLTRLDVAVDDDVAVCVAPKYICSVLVQRGLCGMYDVTPSTVTNDVK